MEILNPKRKAWLRFAVVLLFAGVLITLLLGTAYARYEAHKSQEFAMTYEGSGSQVYLRFLVTQEEATSEELEEETIAEEAEEEDLADDAETENEQTGTEEEQKKEKVTQVIPVILSNGTSKDEYCSHDLLASISVFVTLGAQDPENVRITLTDGDIVYESEYIEVVEGSQLYSMYGPGWNYSFHNEMGEEVTWQLSGSLFIERQLTITVEGSSELPTALHLVASGKPGVK